VSNPLRALSALGQSVWLDSIRRGLIDNGDFAAMIETDDLRGVTSNPAIFEKAIAGSGDYQAALADLVRAGEQDPERLYEALALEDIRRAADCFRPVYERTQGLDGYVSLEVSPHLAQDTEGTCAQARRLWSAIDRPNAMIKVPATPAGIPAIEALLAEGININVTLLFDTAVYAQVAGAHLRALERRVERGEAVDHVASVASFFISRIDSAIDREVQGRIEAGASESERLRLQALEGRVAIANAQRAYRHFTERLESERWRALAGHGARPQRLLWASTSTKNPALSDVHYLQALIAAQTVTTVPPATYEAFREHGRAERSLDVDLAAGDAVIREVEALGLSLERVTAGVLEQGVRLFVEAYDRLLGAVDEARRTAATGFKGLTRSLPAAIERQVSATLEDWQQNGSAQRIWARDAVLWTDSGENEWLGWLRATEDHADAGDRYAAITRLAREGGFEQVLLLGMGGSSLAPEVLAASFEPGAGCPRLRVLDSTDPGQIRRIEVAIDVARTLFVVSSKSGGTLEPNLLLDYFWARAAERLGEDAAGGRFIAITDPGSALEERARAMGFRAIHHGVPSIGGRYSALSPFGLVPAALMGLDVGRLLDRADTLAQACAGCVPAHDNPGVVLGAVLGVCAGQGLNKVTFVAPPALERFGAWLEQLLAESTGKDGQAIIPVYDEALGAPEAYGGDRLFVQLRLAGEAQAEQDAAIARLSEAGHPVVRIDLGEPWDLAAEMFRWEFATAVAGAIMGLNPFDQPDVEASKVATRELTQAYEREGAMPEAAPFLVAEGDPDLELFSDEVNIEAFGQHGGDPARVLRAHLDRLAAGDYFALLAYVDMNQAHYAALQRLRHRVRDARRVATCLGFGPRFLHSTGQAYKGGPNQGVFLQITWQGDAPLAVPGRRASFDVVQGAQARGDFRVLLERGRRALHVHLRGDPGRGLRRLSALAEQALG